MKILFKCLFFTLLVLKIFNATASNYLYTINSNGTISVCSTYKTGRIQTCNYIDPSFYFDQDTPTHIAISADGNRAYISAEHYFYTCIINNDTGYFEKCKLQSRNHGGTHIVSITSDPNNIDRFYVVSADEDPRMRIPTLGTKNTIVVCTKKHDSCTELDRGLYKGVTSLVVSHNGYAYLTTREYDVKEGYSYIFKIYACYINPRNGEFGYHYCHVKELKIPAMNIKIAINPNLLNSEAIYLLINKHADSSIAYCPLKELGSELGDCISKTNQEIGIGGPDAQIQEVAFDNTGKYAYFTTNVGIDNIIRCRITGTSFDNCEPETGGYSKFIKPTSIAYQSGRDNNPPVTLHFKPKVESK